MKEKLTRNIGLKVLSILLAALLWLVITNVDDPVISRPFTNVAVKILNENVIDAPNQTYEILEGETVNFRVAARRSISDNLTSNDFNVTADFAKLMNGNTVMIDITSKKNDVTITEGNRQTLTIDLQETADEDFKVNVVQKGEVKEGYYVGEKTISPLLIRVSGPKSRIEKIKEVVAEVDVNDASRTFNQITLPKALDENGEVIDASKLTFSDQYIHVNLKLYKTKTVELRVNTAGNPAEGHVITGIDFEPKTVIIASEDDKNLEKINYLQLTEIIEGESATVERDINLMDALTLPKGVIMVGDDLTVGVNIKIEKLESKEITIWPNDIGLKNKKENQEIRFGTTGPMKIKIMGLKKDLEELDRMSLKPYIDLTDTKFGTYYLTLKADLPKHSRISDTQLVSIWIVSNQ